MKIVITRQQIQSETREFDLKDGLPNLHGLRLFEVTITHEDIRNGRKHPHFWKWLDNVFSTRFIP